MKNHRLYQFGTWGSFIALCVVSIASLTSISFCALNHILLCLAGFTLSYFHLNKNRGRELPKTFYLLLLFVAIGVISNLTNTLYNPVKSFSQLKYFLFAAVGLISYQEILDNGFLTQKKIGNLIKIFMLITTLGTISGLIALKTGWNPLKFKAACHPDRACGVYGMYMSYGYGIQFFMVLITGMLVHFRYFKEKFNISLFIILLVWVINGAGLYLSYARGALLGFLAAIPFFFYRKYKKLFLASFLIIPLLAGLSFYTVPQVHKMFTDPVRIKSNEERISQYLAAYYTFKENPIFGIGVRNFEPNSVQMKEKYHIYHSEMVGHAHNNFLEILATMGILGFITLFLFHLFWLFEMHKRNDLVGFLVLPVIIALFVSGQTQYTMGDGENMFFLMSLYSISGLKARSTGSGESLT